MRNGIDIMKMMLQPNPRTRFAEFPLAARAALHVGQASAIAPLARTIRARNASRIPHRDVDILVATVNRAANFAI
jgi:hypothetical protein